MIDFIQTFEVSGQDSLKVGWVYSAKRLCAKEDLLERISSLAEMEKEQFHQSRLCVGSKDLLQAVNT